MAQYVRKSVRSKLSEFQKKIIEDNMGKMSAEELSKELSISDKIIHEYMTELSKTSKSKKSFIRKNGVTIATELTSQLASKVKM